MPIIRLGRITETPCRGQRQPRQSRRRGFCDRNGDASALPRLPNPLQRTVSVNQLVPITSAALPTLAATTGEQASIRFLEFFAVNIRNPHKRRAYARSADEFLTWCANAACRRSAPCSQFTSPPGSRPAPASSRHQASSRNPSSVRLARRRPGRAGQFGGLGARAPARRDVGTNTGAQSGGSARYSTASMSRRMPVCVIAR
jgi:hypothetical protein